MKNRILIFGASGFIGSNLSNYLKSTGFEVLELGRSASIQIDFNSTSTWVNLIQENDYIIHLISPASGEEEIHFEATKTLLEVSIKKNISHLVYLSSGGAIYGYGEKAWSEIDPLNPISPYGKLKKKIEALVVNFAEESNLSYSIARPSNVYGENQKFEKQFGAVTTFFHKINQNIPIDILGSLDICKDYLHVSDLNRAIGAMLSKKERGVFNLGSEQNYTLQEIITEVENITEKKAIINYSQSSKTDIPFVRLDCSKAHSVLRWKALINLKEALLLYKKMYH